MRAFAITWLTLSAVCIAMPMIEAVRMDAACERGR
jgi:hypothetical protein